jgi:hypothetical protein
MIDDLNQDEKDKKNIRLIVKKSFYVNLESIDSFLFIPTGSSLKFIKYTSSVIPYYEIKTCVIYLELEKKQNNIPLVIRGNKIINSNRDLTLKNCEHEKLKLKELKWEDVFVQSLDSINFI